MPVARPLPAVPARGRCGLAICALALALAGPLHAVDPFYMNLYRSGIHHYDLGEAATARYELRLACFGMLDEPPMLAECLARLGLAQAAANDDVGFADTFRRIADLEQRFQAWSAAPLASELRARFDQLVEAKVPATTLAVSPGFSALRSAALRRELAGLSPAEQRTRLAERLEISPRDLALLTMAADLALQAGDGAAARGHLDVALAVDARDASVRCLDARQVVGNAPTAGCAPRRGDLAACPGVGQEVAATRLALECALAAGDVTLARQVAARSLAAVRESNQIAPLLAQLPAAPATGGNTPGAAAPRPTAATPPPAPVPGNGSTAPGTPPASAGSGASPAEVNATLATLRQRLAAATSAADAVALLPEAEALAARQPERGDLWHFAAEVAYRGSRWADVVQLVERGGPPGADAAALGFYYAVALYETGNQAAAAQAARAALPGLQRTPFVDAYLSRILSSGATASP